MKALPDGYRIRRISAGDDAALASIIRTVMPEFGACGPGFAINDPEVDSMSGTYLQPRAAYFVVEQHGVVVGGGGIAPLAGAPEDTCELRKMYFLKPARGRGVGEILLHLCLEAAGSLGFRRCYLETMSDMSAARRMYEKAGFRKLCAPMGATGHFGCDSWYALDLT